MTELQTSVLTYLTLIICGSVVLKLGGIIHWSWWWVLIPLWLPIAIVGIVVTLILIARLRDGNYW